MIIIKPIATEKAIRAVEIENKISFIVDRRARKAQIKEEVEEMFKVKVEKINVYIKNNQKIAIIKLRKETPAIDIATKLGMI